MSERRLSKPSRLPSTRFALEPRIVFDGAMPVAAAAVAEHAEAAASAHAQPVEHARSEHTNIERAPAAAAPSQVAPPFRPVIAKDAIDQDQRLAAEPADAAPRNREIVFIDASAEGIDAYLPGFKGQVVTLSADRDGMDQIAAALAGRSDITAIHIISHGGAGFLSLGNGSLDATTIDTRYAADLAAIGAALTRDGDILLYGCDVAAGAVGRSFIAQLATATGGDIAASTDDTGAARLGGNWTLEASTGPIEARALDASGYDALLAAPVLALGGVLTTNYATAYVENAQPTAIAGLLDTITQIGGSGTLQSATITLTNRQAGDVLTQIGLISPNISQSFYNATTGTLTLSGTDTFVNYAAALRTIGYASASENPSSVSRTISVVVNDGTTNSNVATTTIAITPVDDAPIVTVAANTNLLLDGDFENTLQPNVNADNLQTLSYGAFTASNQINIVRVDNTGYLLGPDRAQSGVQYLDMVGGGTIQQTFTLTSAQTITFGGSFANRTPFDSYTLPATAIQILDSNGLQVGLAATPALPLTTLSGAETWYDARGAVVLAAGTYTFRVTLGDYAQADNLYARIGLNNAIAYTINNAPMLIAPAATTADVDNANLTSATITVNNRSALDLLSVVGVLPTGITASGYNAFTGILTLSGSATLAAYQTAIREIGFSSTSLIASATGRAITVAVSDGTLLSPLATTTITVFPAANAPAAFNDSFGTPHDTPYTLDVLANDSDASTSPLTVSAINGMAVFAGGASVAVTGGRVALTTAGKLLFTPTAGYVGSTSFTYSAIDTSLAVSTATVTGNVTDAAPVIDLNSGSSATQRIVNGSFTGGATSWTATGSGSASGNVYFWDTDSGTGTLTQTGLTGLNSGYGTSGAAQVTFDLAWNNGNPDTAVPATLDLSIGGVVYARLTTSSDNANGSVASITYLNGAAGPTSSITSSTYGSWTYANIVVNLPANVAASGALQFSYAAGTGGGDDISIDNVSVLTRTDAVTGIDYATSYTENAVPVSIAAAGASAYDNDNTLLASATIVLTNAQAGDVLTPIGFNANNITISQYDESTHTITLTGTDTAANYAAAIRSIGFSNTTDNPSTTPRTINVTVNDGLMNSAVATTTVNVVAVNDPPVLNLGNNANLLVDGDFENTLQPNINGNNLQGTTYGAYTATGANINILRVDGTGYAPAPDNAYSGTQYLDLQGSGSIAQAFTLSSAQTISFGGAFSNRQNDTSGYTAPSTTINILNASGTVVATATAVNLTRASGDENWYLSTGSASLAAGNYTFQVVMSDYAQLDTVYVRVSGYAASYTENAVPTPITASGNAITDLDNTTMTSATIVLTNAQPLDLLSVIGTLPTGITASSYDSTTGTLTLSGTATSAAYATALTRIGYSSTSENPSATPRVINVTVNDGTSNSNVGVSTINVIPVNDAPTCTGPTTVSSAEDTTLSFTGGNALTVSDVDSPNLTVSLTVAHGTLTLGTTTGLTFGSGTGTANGSMTFSGTQAQLNAALASLTYRPGADYNGSDTLGFGTSDGALSTARAIALTVTPVADITADSVTTTQNAAISFNAITGTNGATPDTFSDPSRTVTSVTQGAHGTVTFTAAGVLTYTPNTNYVGTDTFTYTVTSGGVTETATETITVTAVNQAPTSGAPASRTAAEDTTVAFTGANALTVADVDSPTLSVTLTVAHGTLTLGTITGLAFTTGTGTANASMTFSGTQAQLNAALASLTYRPGADYNGSDTFGFSTSDGSLATARSIALTIAPVADITADSVTTNENAAIAFNAITGTNGATADTFSDPGRAVTSVTQGAHGTVAFTASGVLTYTPNTNYSGIDTFTYTVTSGGTTETATETVTVTFVNQPPVGTAPTTVTTAEDTTVNFTGGNALSVADVDSPTLTVTLNVAHGTLTLGTLTGLTFTTGTGTANATMTFSGTQAQLNNALASLSYRPGADYNGSDALGFSTSDGSLTSTRSVALTVTPVADITADNVTTNENTTISFNAVTGTNGATADTFSDPGRAITSVTQGANGTVGFTAAGVLTYTPNANFSGTDTFTYTVTSGGVTETATETVTVNFVDQAPTSTAPTTITSAEDTTLAFTGGNALRVADVDSAMLSVTLTVNRGTLTLGTLTGLTFTTGTGTANGTMTFSGTQAQLNAALASLTFRPDADFNGTGTLGFTTSDGLLNTARSIALTITPVADITADSVTTNENSAVTFNAITGTNGATADTFSDPSRAVTSVTQGAHGTVTFNADGTLVYTPDANYAGTDTFNYTVTSGGTTETATETVTIAFVNQAPTGTAPTAISSNEDTTLAFTGGNALSVADVDSPTLTVSLNVAHGTLTLGTITGLAFTTGTGTADASMSFSGTQAQLNAALASLTYRPGADYNGSDTLGFSTSDGSLNSAKTVALTMIPVADITADNVTTAQNVAVSFNAITGTNGATADTFSDPTRAVTSVTPGAHGTVTFTAAGVLTYTPNTNYSGIDTFTYTVMAGGTTETATETVTVGAVDQAPTSTAPTVRTTAEDTTVAFTGANALTVGDVDSPTLSVTLTVTHGTLTLGTLTGLTFTNGSGTGDASMTFSGTQAQLNAALASLTYRASADYNGSDALAFSTSDGSLTVGKTIALTVTPVADITADSVTTNENTTISFNAVTGTNGATADTFSDPGRAITSVTQGANGTVGFTAAGVLTYTPNANFSGTDTFTYTVTSGGVTETATETVTVNFVDQAPTSAAPTTFAVNEDVARGFRNADTLTVGDVDSPTLTVTLNVAHGTLTLGTVTGLAFTTGTGTANASMTFSGTQAALNNALSSLSYQASPDYNGSDTLAFTTSDGSLATTKSIALTIAPVADITADSVTTNENSAITFNAITGTNGATADTFSDPGRAVTSVTQGTHGTVAYNADGTLTYTPNANYAGTDTFSYTVASGGTTETATETVTIHFVNQAPISTAPTTVVAAEDTTVNFTGGNALSVADVDSPTLTVTLNVAHGKLTLGTVAGLTFTTGTGTADATMTFSGTQAQLNAALASLSFRPEADFNGVDTLGFTTSDGSLTTTRSVALTIAPVTDITADSVTTNENSAITFNAITGTNGATADTFSDPGRAVTSVTQGAHGTVAYNADGTLTYTPNANYAGTDTFSYTVASGGTTETATETVTIHFVNQAPVSTAPTTVVAAEDTTVNFTSGNALSVADVDSPTLTVTLDVAHGKLTLGTVAGLTFTTGTGTADTTMTFSGTQAQLNSALSSLSYRPDPDYNGSDVLGFATSDGSLTTSKSVALTITPVADITADRITTNQNTAISFNAITGTNGATADTFSDPTRAVTSVTQGQHGTVTFTAAGLLTYTPDATFFGTDSYAYTVTAGGSTETASVTMTVVHVNQAPVANNDSFSVAQGAIATIDVRANDTDADGDILTVTQVDGTAITAGGPGVAVSGGIVTLGSGGDLIYTPNASYRGPTGFSYTVADPFGATSTASVSGTVTPVNHAPITGDDVATVDEDHDTVGNVLTNDSDPDGDALTVSAVNGNGAQVGSAVSGSNGGLFTIRADGSYTFATNGQFENLGAGQSRSTTISYTASDGQGGSTGATITITVTGVNDAPVAVADVFDTTDTSGAPSGLPLRNNVLANDTDAEHDTLTVTAVNGSGTAVGTTTAGNYGALTLDADGSFTYAVDRTNLAVLALLRGQAPLVDQFTYTASDGHGGTASTTLSVRIQGTNDGPMAGNDSNAIVSGQSGATGNVITGVRTDGSGTTTTVPSAMDLDPGFTLNVDAIRLPGDSVGTVVTPTATGSRTGLYGTLTIDTNGNYSYLLDNGSAAVMALGAGQTVTDSFVYTVSDGVHTIDATILVSIGGRNAAPIAQDDSFVTAEGTQATINVRANDSDPNHDPIRVTAINGTAVTAGGAGVAVTGGVVTLDTSGDLVFTAGTYDRGATAFTYTIEDPSGASATATVSGTVTPVNHAPTAVADSFATPQNTAVTIAVVANDSDVDGDALAVTQVNGNAIAAGGPGVVVDGGVVTLTASGGLIFTPDHNYTGSMSFRYTVADPSGATASATVSGNVAHVNQPPVARADAFTSPQDTTATIDVRVNDSDPDGDALTVTQVNGTSIIAGGPAVAVTGGTVALGGAGNLVFTPTSGFRGATSFTYTVSDPFGATGTATVSGTITGVNHPPVAGPGSFTVAQNAVATIDARMYDSDPDGDPLTITQVNGTAIVAGGASIAVSGGSVRLDTSGNLLFTPTSGYLGSTSFSYTVADPSGASATASIGGTVTPAINRAPVANADSFTIPADTPATFDVRANDTDADGDPLTVTRINGTAIAFGGPAVAVTGGTIALDSAGRLVFVPTAGFVGPLSFTYTVADPSGATASASVSGTVSAAATPGNHPPVANADSFTIRADTPATFDVRANDNDADGDPLTVTRINGTAIAFGGPAVAVAGGTIALDSAGRLVFTPTAGFVGPLSFTYTVSDPSGATASATVNGTVTPNHPPVANADSFSVAQDTPAVVDVRANDTDADGDPLIVTRINGNAIVAGGTGVAVTGGVVTLNAAGNLVFTPTAGYRGPTAFSYTVADPSGATGTASVSGTVTPVNHPPVIRPDSFTSPEDTPVAINVRANDTDVDGDPITITQVDGTAIVAGGPGVAVTGGVVTLDASGNLVFTPTANYHGPIAFSYTASDPSGVSGTASVSGTVTPVNDAPIAVADTVTGPSGAPFVIDVLGNDLDVDGNRLLVTAIDGHPIAAGGPGVAVAGGVVTLNANGTLLFTPTVASGSAPLPQTTFSYTATDASGAMSSARITVVFDTVIRLPDPGPAGPIADAPFAPVTFLPSLAPSLSVLGSVGDASQERALYGTIGTVPVDVVTAMAIADGLREDLGFAMGDAITGVALITRHADLTRDGVNRHADTLFVQHAVRHETLPDAQSLHVQKAVREAQNESALIRLRADGANAFDIGSTTLLDPFAIGAPMRSPAPADQPAPAEQSTAAPARHAAVDPASPGDFVPIDSLRSLAGGSAARGFGAQLAETGLQLHPRGARIGWPARTEAVVVARNRTSATGTSATGDTPATR